MRTIHGIVWPLTTICLWSLVAYFCTIHGTTNLHVGSRHFLPFAKAVLVGLSLNFIGWRLCELATLLNWLTDIWLQLPAISQLQLQLQLSDAYLKVITEFQLQLLSTWITLAECANNSVVKCRLCCIINVVDSVQLFAGTERTQLNPISYPMLMLSSIFGRCYPFVRH